MAKRAGTSLESIVAAQRSAQGRAVATDAESAPEPTLPFVDDNAPVPINIYVTDADRHRLRQFALERRTTVQALGHRAWNLLLAEEGLPPLAPATSYVPVGRKRRGGA